MDSTQWIAAIFLVGALVWGSVQWAGHEDRMEEIHAQTEAAFDQMIERHASEAQERRQAYVDAHPELSDFVRDAILQGSIVRGMSPDEVVASWGEPDRKNISSGSGGHQEQWVYHGAYIYLRRTGERFGVDSWQTVQ